MSDVIEQLRSVIDYVRRGRDAPQGSADIAQAAIREIERLRAELAEHVRRAALVEQWAEGLRAGKRYACIGPNHEAWDTTTVRLAHSREAYYVVRWAVNKLMGGRHEDPARAAAYMLAVSEDWAEVTNE